MDKTQHATIPAERPAVIDLNRAAYRWRPAPQEAPVTNRAPLGFSDWAIFLAAAAAVLGIATHRHGAAEGLILFAALTRAKILFLERGSRHVPDWLLVAIPSAVLWGLLWLLM